MGSIGTGEREGGRERRGKREKGEERGSKREEEREREREKRLIWCASQGARSPFCSRQECSAQ